MANWFTFPDRTDGECRQNGRKNDCQISSQGKVPPICGKVVHFPWKKQQNSGGINISGGKVPGIRGNLVHFPGGSLFRRIKPIEGHEFPTLSNFLSEK